MKKSRLIACSSLAASLFGAVSAAWAISPVATPAPGDIQPIPIVVFGDNGRETINQFASKEKENAAILRKDYAGSGIVQCGRAHGAGQVTLASDVITTAAHVFFDEKGRLRAPACEFELMRDKSFVRIPIDLKSIKAGSRDPYSLPAVNDWAVARLARPVLDATPYQIAKNVAVNDRVRFVARGHIDWGQARRLSIQACRLRRQTNSGPEGTREFAFDCDTGDGASGGAVMIGPEPGKLAAVLVGYRSIDPSAAMPYSPLHYNFVVSLQGKFRQAVTAMANPKVVTAEVATREN